MVRFAVPVVFPAGLAPALPSPSTRVVAVIPSRFSSTRLPGKPLALINGMTMVEHVYRRAEQARFVHATVVATDDERIAETVSGFGGIAVMTRGDHQSGTDRLAEVAAAIDAEFIVNVQGDEPLMSPGAIDAAIAQLMGSHDQLSTLRKRIDDPDDLDNPSVVKVVVDRDGYALYFSRAAVPYVRAGQTPPVMWRHLGLYVYRRDVLLKLSALAPTALERAEGLEQLRALEHGFRIATVETATDAIGVDTPEDLDRVRRLVERTAHGAH